MQSGHHLVGLENNKNEMISRVSRVINIPVHFRASFLQPTDEVLQGQMVMRDCFFRKTMMSKCRKVLIMIFKNFI